MKPAALVFALVAAAFVGEVASHGYLAEPMARNVAAWKANQYYCPQCGNGQGSEPGAWGGGVWRAVFRRAASPSRWHVLCAVSHR